MKLVEVETTDKAVVVKLAMPTKVAIALGTVIMTWTGAAQASQLIAILQSTLGRV